jgi:hypothetical protein
VINPAVPKIVTVSRGRNREHSAAAETWHRILNAIERLQAEAPAEGENVH